MADRFPLIVDSSAQQLQELAVGDNLNLASSGLINADNIQTSGLSVGVMTATSFIGDGSQLTNLPAAGSSTELTASGTLADGDPVVVNTDGTVSTISQLAWIATPGGTQAQDMAIDSSGNIYVAGYGSQTTSYSDGFVQKYNTAGSLQWQRYLGGGFETSTIFSSVALDSSGNVYVAGYTNMQGAGSWDILVAKYNSSGGIQWQRILGGSSTDQSIGIAVDSSANVYISAYTQSSGQGDRDFLVAKYNTSGTLQWQYTLGDSYAQIARDVVVDSSGNFYVTGYNAIGNFPSYQKRFIVAKYNSSGNLQWQKVLYGSSDEDGQAIAVDSSDNIYITGFSDSTGGGGDDIVVAKYNSSGTVQWQRKLTGSSNEVGNGITVDSSGNVYIVGYTNSGGPGGYSIVIAKYNTSGTIQWQRHLGGSSTDQGRGIVVDNSGNFYICGNSSSTSTAGFIIARFPDDGTSTGTYGNLTYGDSSSYLTDGAAGLSEGTSSLTQSYPSSAGLTPATSTLNENASTLTPSIEASASTLTAENYIGISDGAYTNGQTATVQLIGSVDDAQSSLTPGQKYYVQTDGTLSTTAGSPSVLAGTAIASTKLLIKK